LNIPPTNDINEPPLDEKLLWEKQATEVFIAWYSQAYSTSFTFVSHNLPAKPDVSCLLNGSELDLEIAHLYGTEQEAMSILGKSLNQHTRDELIKLRLTSSTQDRLIAALNRILENKSHKTYDSNRVWLVIRNVHPGWQASQLALMHDSLVIPENHSFEQIWLVGDVDAASGAICLYNGLV
jgi:hypothetical protein